MKRFSGLINGRWLQVAMLAIVLLAGFAARMANLNDPPLDFHPVRQLRSAIIARGMYFDANPQADPALRAIAHDLANQDVHEPAILESVVSVGYLLTGGENLWVARVLSSLFWLAGGLALIGLSRRYTSFWAGLVGLLVYVCLPFSIVASRAFQPDPWMVMWILLNAYAAVRWAESRSWGWALAAGVFGGLGFLIKAVAGFFIAGVMAAVVLTALGLGKALRSKQVWVMAALAAIPALVYYLLLNSGRAGEYFGFNTVEHLYLLLRTKTYVQWLGMVNSLFGLTMFVLALLGTLLAEKRLRAVLLGLWFGYALYGLAWPFQYTTHDYYQMPLIAIIAIGLAPVAEALIKRLNEQPWILRAAAVVLISAAAGYQLYAGRSALVANDFSYEPRSWQLVGQAVVGEPFVALTNDYGLRLQYYGWRKPTAVWPGTNDLADMKDRTGKGIDVAAYFKDITQGKTYFLVTALGEFEAQPELKALLTKNYPISTQGSGWMVYDLVHPLSKP